MVTVDVTETSDSNLGHGSGTHGVTQFHTRAKERAYANSAKRHWPNRDVSYVGCVMRAMARTQVADNARAAYSHHASSLAEART
jgi:hypothetical protein